MSAVRVLRPRRKPKDWPIHERLAYAAKLAKQLRDEGSPHLWSVEECGLLAALLEVLGVEWPQKGKRDAR